MKKSDVYLTVYCLESLTVNLLDSRSVMGDLGWVAYPKNGVSFCKIDKCCVFTVTAATMTLKLVSHECIIVSCDKWTMRASALSCVLAGIYKLLPQKVLIR